MFGWRRLAEHFRHTVMVRIGVLQHGGLIWERYVADVALETHADLLLVIGEAFFRLEILVAHVAEDVRAVERDAHVPFLMRF